MRSFRLLAVASVAIGLFATPALAQIGRLNLETVSGAPNEQELISEAQRAVSMAGISCQPVENRWGGSGRIQQGDDPENLVDVRVYEVRCASGSGFILGATETRVNVQPCIEAALARRLAEAEEAENLPQVCQLPSNANQAGYVQPYVDASGAVCRVEDAELLALTTTGIYRYEVGCSNSDGLWVDVTRGSTTPDAVYTCLQVTSLGETCRYTTAAESQAWAASLVSQGGSSCAPTGARFVGGNETHRYYEVSCQSGEGFMVGTLLNNAYDQLITCADAVGIGTGCTLTHVTARAAGQQFIDLLTANNVSCDYVAHATPRRETSGAQRYVMEYQCNDRPTGLVAFLPAEPGQGEVRQMDCITAEHVLHARCTLTDRSILMASISQAIQTRGRTCTVEEFETLGGAGDGGDVVEARCAAGSSADGFLLELDADRRGVGLLQTCAQARAAGDRCDL